MSGKGSIPPIPDISQMFSDTPTQFACCFANVGHPTAILSSVNDPHGAAVDEMFDLKLFFGGTIKETRTCFNIHTCHTTATAVASEGLSRGPSVRIGYRKVAMNQSIPKVRATSKVNLWD